MPIFAVGETGWSRRMQVEDEARDAHDDREKQ